MTHEFDLLVIGAGSGGVRAARMAAGLGKRVAVVERQYLGGTCVNVGCIPKKLFHYAGQYSNHFHEAAGFGWQVPAPSFDWSILVDNVSTEVARLNGIYRNLLENSGVQVISGEARLLGPHQVGVENDVYTAERILLAVGCTPFKPDIPGAGMAITSDDFFSLTHKPASVVVVGGGYIAVELACVLHGLGVAVTLLHRGDTVLKHFDTDIRAFLQQQMEQQGIPLLLGESVTAIRQQSGGLLELDCASGKTLTTACLLYATGRRPLIAPLGIDALGIAVQPTGHIITDENFRTTVPSVYAIGDAVGHKELTPVALAEAMWLVDHWYGSGSKPRVNYELVPSCVFSVPEVGTVGLTQQDAEQRFGVDDVVIYRSEFRPLKHTVSGASERTLMKLVVQRSTDKVLGLHMVGAEAGEIVQGFSVAMQMGATKQQLDSTIGIHPTAAEEFVTMRTPVAR